MLGVLLEPGEDREAIAKKCRETNPGCWQVVLSRV